jgi:hypothetical protein
MMRASVSVAACAPPMLETVRMVVAKSRDLNVVMQVHLGREGSWRRKQIARGADLRRRLRGYGTGRLCNGERIVREIVPCPSRMQDGHSKTAVANYRRRATPGAGA